jgi:hypothetical protein
VLKWVFGTAILLDVEKLHETIDHVHRTEGDVIHSVNYQATYLKTLDSAVKFNTETVETLSEKVKAIMLDSNKWKDGKVSSDFFGHHHDRKLSMNLIPPHCVKEYP